MHSEMEILILVTSICHFVYKSMRHLVTIVTAQAKSINRLTRKQFRIGET